MATRPLGYHVVDVFTTRRFKGNPLAIVARADGLSDETMRVVASEFNLSETIFVNAPERVGHEASVRIFTPTRELPFAGHPTIGCAIHLAERHWPKGPVDETLVLEERVGLVPVRVVRENGIMRATFTAPVVPSGRALDIAPALAAAALGLNDDDIARDHPIAWHEGGPAFLYVPLASIEALGRAKPSGTAFSELTAAAGCGSVYCYAADGERGWRTRMFAPDEGIPEDPATGSAAAILASQLVLAGTLIEGTNAFGIRQGVEMGRESEIGLEIDIRDGAIASVRVSGSAVRVADGQILV